MAPGLNGIGLGAIPRHGGSPVLFMDPDSWEYHRIASNLLAGNGYSWDTQPPYSPNFYRVPGFPVVLLGLYSLTGPSIPAAIAVQAVVSTATILLTFLLARALTGRIGISLGAAAVQALDPVAIQYSNILLTETFTSPLILLTAYCVWNYLGSARPGWLAGAGAILGVGILVHPVLLFLPLLLPAVPLLARAKKDRDLAVEEAGHAGDHLGNGIGRTLPGLGPRHRLCRNVREGEQPHDQYKILKDFHRRARSEGLDEGWG